MPQASGGPGRGKWNQKFIETINHKELNMPKLTYWVCPCTRDSSCYNIRTKTRKEAVAQLAMYKDGGYGPPMKHTIHYTGALDLVQQCMGEGRGFEPNEYDLED